MLNPFKVLGVHRKSTDEEMRNAFYDLARKYHPDTGTGDPAKFSAASQAYRMLSEKKQLNVTLARFEVYGNKCEKCKATGVKAKTTGMTSKSYTACTACGGCGFISKTKEKEDDEGIIELRGTVGAGSKGRNKKR